MTASGRSESEHLEDLAQIDREGRVGRTAVQVGVPTAMVVIGSWAAALAGIDLDPGPGRDLPAVVAAAWVTVVAFALAWWMNRQPPVPVDPQEPVDG